MFKAKSNVLTTVFVLLVLTSLLLLNPVVFTSHEAIEKVHFLQAGCISERIGSFRDMTGRMPGSFGELAEEGYCSRDIRRALADPEGDLSEIPIQDYSGKRITLEIEAVWQSSRDDQLIWARTKRGFVVRIQKQVVDSPDAAEKPLDKAHKPATSD